MQKYIDKLKKRPAYRWKLVERTGLVLAGLVTLYHACNGGF